MKTMRLAAILVAVAIAAGCAGRKATQQDDEATAVPSTPSQSETRPARPTPPTEPELTPEQRRELEVQKMLSTRTLYFEYDESEIRPEYLDVIAAHAQHLVRNPDQRILLEGHCDERGSREYNIGLGERRAHAVRRAMLVQGVSASQIRTISYGEERPAVPGHNESAWARNRRVEIVYR